MDRPVLVQWGQRWWKGQWYKARIKNVQPNGHYNIHYQDHGDEWDETVSPQRLRQKK